MQTKTQQYNAETCGEGFTNLEGDQEDQRNNSHEEDKSTIAATKDHDEPANHPWRKQEEEALSNKRGRISIATREQRKKKHQRKEEEEVLPKKKKRHRRGE